MLDRVQKKENVSANFYHYLLLNVSATNNNPQTTVFDTCKWYVTYANSYYTWDSKFQINMTQELRTIKLTVVPTQKSVPFTYLWLSRMSCCEQPNSQSYSLLIQTVVPFNMNLINQNDWPDSALNAYNYPACPFYFRGSIGVQLF
jgi:ribosomal protein L20